MELTLWRDDATLARSVAAAGERHERRARLYLRASVDGLEGWGEVSPQAAPLNGDPGVDDVIDELRVFTLRAVAAAAAREGGPPAWTRVARFAGSRPASPVASALVEMALLDLELRRDGDAIAAVYPPRGTAPVQATVSLIEEGEWAIDGAARVRAKVAPGAPPGWALERLRALDVPVILDFNASARGRADVVATLLAVGPACRVVAVEQPFAPGNLADHAALAATIDVAVSLDESVRARRDVDAIARYGAASMVCVKPPRVGGLAVARSVLARARDLGLAAYLGGFFESGLARSAHRALADHCVTEPSDVAPVARADLDGPEVVVSEGGIGVAPSAALRERLGRPAAEF